MCSSGYERILATWEGPTRPSLVKEGLVCSRTSLDSTILRAAESSTSKQSGLAPTQVVRLAAPVVCGAAGCAASKKTSCDDGNGCTSNACDATKVCVHTKTGKACDDKGACTEKDVCGVSGKVAPYVGAARRCCMKTYPPAGAYLPLWSQTRIAVDLAAPSSIILFSALHERRTSTSCAWGPRDRKRAPSTCL